MHNLNRWFCSFLLAALGVLPDVQAQTKAELPSVVVMRGNGVEVSSVDLEVDLQKAPLEARKNMLTSADGLARLATNLHMRRALANEAEKKGLATDPKVAAALSIARDRILSDALVAEMDATIKPDDAALEAYAAAVYRTQKDRFKTPEEVRAAHILVSGGNDEARIKASELLAQLRQAADFDELAKRHSIDKSNANKGGDLGFFNRDRMVKPFSDAAFALKVPGELSDLVETQFGFHIIKLLDRKPESIKSFDEVRDTLRKEALAKMQNDMRLAQEQRLLQGAILDREAVEAFAAKNK